MSSVIFTAAFWKGAGERAIFAFLETFFPVLIAVLGVTLTGTFNVWAAPWVAALQSASGIGLGSAFLSLVKSLGVPNFTAGHTVIPGEVVSNVQAEPNVNPLEIQTITNVVKSFPPPPPDNYQEHPDTEDYDPDYDPDTRLGYNDPIPEGKTLGPADEVKAS